MPSDLYLVRHGRAIGNQEGRYLGRGSDPPLTKDGEREARALAAWFASRFPPTEARSRPAVYTSGLQRADSTARVIARGLGVPPRIRGDLRELDFGEWEGKTYEEVMARWPHRLWAWYEAPLDVSPPGGETLRELIDRVWAAFCRIIEDRGDGGAVVVTHGGPIRALLALAAQCELDPEGAGQVFFSFPCRTGSVSAVRASGTRADPAHLRIRFHNYCPGR